VSELAGRAHRATDSLHSMIYFAPEAEEQLVAAGLRPGRMTYFASRSAPMGAVTAGVTTATFVNFNPDLVAKYIPRAWTLASIDAILAAWAEGQDAETNGVEARKAVAIVLALYESARNNGAPVDVDGIA